MRLMGQCYGYAAATMPMIGQVKTELKEGSRCNKMQIKCFVKGVSMKHTFNFTFGGQYLRLGKQLESIE